MFGISKTSLAHLLNQQTQAILEAIQKEGESIMGNQAISFADVQSSLDALTKAQQQVSSDISSAVADIKSLSEQISTLQSQGGATPQQLADLKTSIDQITASLSGASSSLEAVLPTVPATS